MKGTVKAEEKEVDALSTNRSNTDRAPKGRKQARSWSQDAQHRGRRRSCGRCGTTHAGN